MFPTWEAEFRLGTQYRTLRLQLKVYCKKKYFTLHLACDLFGTVWFAECRLATKHILGCFPDEHSFSLVIKNILTYDGNKTLKDCCRFPGKVKKTLFGQSLESVFAQGIEPSDLIDVVEQDLLP